MCYFWKMSIDLAWLLLFSEKCSEVHFQMHCSSSLALGGHYIFPNHVFPSLEVCLFASQDVRTACVPVDKLG